MKRIFVVAMVFCVGACASQPQNPNTSNETLSGEYANASPAQPAQSSGRVYKDDFDRLHVRAAPRDTRVLILGRKEKTEDPDSGLE